MLKEFVEKILDLAKTELIQVDGLDYSPRPLTLVVPPKLVSAVELHTLTGLADALGSKLDSLNPPDWMIVVYSYDSLGVVKTMTDAYGRREVLLNISLEDGEVFPFNKFIPREEFVIQLQSRMVQDITTEELLRLCSTLEASAVAIAEDDGISQSTTVRQGIALKEKVVVRGRRKLRPYRTFREVEQPVSEFVFRMRSNGVEVPQCALFEADGGTWKLDAVLAIKQWLEAKNLGLPVVA